MKVLRHTLNLMIMNEAERILWEEVGKLPEHKREFDTDVFHAIIAAMERYAAHRIYELDENNKKFDDDELG